MLIAPVREIELAEWTQQMQQSMLRDIHALLARPGLLSFALGLPSPEMFPVQEYARAAQHVLSTATDALQYGMPLRRLRQHVVELMARRGVECTEDEVFITSGAQQGMSLLGQLLVSPGRAVVVDELTYDGMLGALRPLRPRVLTVPSRPGEGMDVDALEELLASGERPALVYTVPEGSNPLGTRMPPASRMRLAAVAREHGVPVLEDDAYGLLSYDGEAPAAVRSYDADWVLYLGSFSKIMAPGVRTGWVVAPGSIVQRLSIVKQGNDLDVCTFAQRALSEFMDGAEFGAHLQHIRGAYGARRDAMLAALEAYFPAEARWNVPHSGMFIWVEMPDGTAAGDLLRRSVAEAGVGFVPGQAFCARGGIRGGNALRLNFTRATSEQIHDGVQRLGALLEPRRPILPVPTGFRIFAPGDVDCAAD